MPARSFRALRSDFIRPGGDRDKIVASQQVANLAASLAIQLLLRDARHEAVTARSPGK